MPANTTILMIRHAEKPKSGTGLAVAGQARAHAYAIYFQNYLIGKDAVVPDYLFATANSAGSHRPQLTVMPLAVTLGLSIDDHYKNDDYPDAADEITGNPDYDDSTLVICWHHGKILRFAKALGVKRRKLPPSSNWPSKWPGSVFGWVLQICFDSSGNVIPDQTICINEQLMYDDHGQDPPGL